ncbi:o-succinylbenzoate synthase [Ectothiorhodospira lacustris]|uniref:o-succinylbenzoate synthase n=1 Tax=Ectothiorhodospira lacustris TaxID=2899127 RepID=UPI001EE7E817|nr:o-succinylbenzoate synthase [Ectothiorhodospira lacustris]MCG5499433.1 o-succinylbenzoate synthase [Ectothiorhodospira lacustris]
MEARPPHEMRLWRFSLPLRQPLPMPGHRLTQREGLLLEWCRPRADSLWSEISPLPGFSQATLDQCLQQIRQILDRGGAPVDRFRHLPTTTAPEVRFGLEAGLLQWTQHLPPAASVPRCCLIRHDDALDLADDPEPLCFKLKVGRDALATDIDRIQHVAAQLAEGQWLRLDANRSWNLEQAETLCQAIDRQRIQFIEEPLRAGSDYRQWWPHTGIPFAWDETLREGKTPDLWTPGLGALVIKPMLTGLNRSSILVHQARRRGIPAILSAAYESNLSLDLYARLVHHWDIRGPQGLDTFGIFARALLMPILSQPEHHALPITPQAELEYLGCWT